jgi:hypothetical protein
MADRVMETNKQPQIGHDGCRAVWERPELRRLATNKAANGNKAGNDGTGSGVGAPGHHPS